MMRPILRPLQLHALRVGASPRQLKGASGAGPLAHPFPMRHAGDASSAMAAPDTRMLDLDRLERVLVSAAVERRPVTYGQVLRYFGRKVTRITVGALCRDLGAVCRRVEAVGGPDL